MRVANHHAVQFYGDQASLFKTVGGFLGEGLVAGQPAILIATPEHRAGILDELTSRYIDVAKARHDGDLVVLDAEETLDLFIIDELPDAEAFHVNLSRYIDQMLQGRSGTMLRAYGEMVDVLWKQGRSEAAIRLELLWNQLIASRGFALLCSYAMGNFYRQADKFQEVCACHSQVLEPGDKIRILDRSRRKISIA